MSDVVERLTEVRRRVAAAARTAGRSVEAVRLVAVSKRQPLDLVRAAFHLGVTDFGENTAQGLLEKAEAFASVGSKVRWHFIGRLQRNKINKVLPHVHLIQTLDREALADALAQRAGPKGIGVLVQVNIGEEPQKGGVSPTDAVRFAREVADRPGLVLKGLMAMPPYGVSPEPFFRHMQLLFQQLRATPEGGAATELSLGMTDDFEQAIHLGATIVRVGTGIFGERES